MKHSVIIINYKTKEMTSKAIESVLSALREEKTEVVLIDNSSNDGSREYFEEKYNKNNFKLIFNNENLGFAKAVNQGIKNSQGEYLILLNSDVIAKNNFVDLIKYLEKNKNVGLVGPRMVYGDGRLQYSFGRFPSLINEFSRLFWLYKIMPWGTVTWKNKFSKNIFENISKVDWVTGGCMAISREVIEKIGKLDENYYFGVEDMDICCQIKKAGLDVVYNPKVEVIHYHGFSSGGKRSVFKLNYEQEGINYFMKKNFPKKKISRHLINLFYSLKIFMIKKRDKNSLDKIKDAVFAITYKCNSRCVMCNIWQKQWAEEIKPSDLENLPASIRDINLSGGEPFLNSGIVKIVEKINEKNSKANIIISSNGFATELIKQKMSEIIKIKPNIGIAISLDGIGEVHEKIRGIKGAYEKVLNTLSALKDLEVKNIKLAFTLSDSNAGELKKVYNLSRELSTELTLTVVHSSDNFFGADNKINKKEELIKELDWLMKKELKSMYPKKWVRAYYTHGMKRFVLSGERILPDYSGKYNLFIDPKGSIYPCDISSKKIGQIVNGNFVLNGNTEDEQCSKSWMICTARASIKKHWFRAISWIIINKIKIIF